PYARGGARPGSHWVSSPPSHKAGGIQPAGWNPLERVGTQRGRAVKAGPANTYASGRGPSLWNSFVESIHRGDERAPSRPSIPHRRLRSLLTVHGDEDFGRPGCGAHLVEDGLDPFGVRLLKAPAGPALSPRRSSGGPPESSRSTPTPASAIPSPRTGGR